MKKILLLIFGFLSFCLVEAQTARDAAVEIYVELKSSGVNIHWKPDANATKYLIYKRSNAKVDWLLLDSVSGTTNTYFDAYFGGNKPIEYRVAKKSTKYSFYGNGYALVGQKIPAKTTLGKVLLVIDSNYSVPLKNNLTEYKDQLYREGWQVISKTVLRTDSIQSIKNWIKNQWFTDSANIKCIFLLGHVPVPYSGNYRPDGHLEHTGAWPADMYYGNFYSNWSDNNVNNTQAAYSRNHNTPGDGKFDISRVNPIGTTLGAIQYAQIPVGRVDLYNMNSFGNDTMLMKRYLTKDLNFRRGVHKAIPRGLIDDNFGYFSSEAFASGGFRNFSPQFKDSVFERDYRTSMSAQSYLMSYGCGAGTYTGCSGVSSSADFVNDSLLNPFTMMFGSYFGDWDNSDNMLRAPLASRGWGLANVWSGRPYWMLHECALGNPLASATLTSVNSYYFYNAAAFQSGVHTALMGDPTLTLYPIAALKNSKAIAKCTDMVRFRWDLHPDAVDSVIIEEKIAGSWKIIARVMGSDTSISKKASTGAHFYSIRPLKLMSSASGSWWQYGAREFTEVSVNVPAKALAITSTKTACESDSVIVAELKFGNTPPYKRSWYVNGVLNADTSVSFKSVFKPGKNVVLMSLLTDSACLYVDSVKFTIFQLPTAKPSFISAKSVCLGQPLVMKSQSIGQNIWIIGADTVSKSDSISFVSKTHGSFSRVHFIKDSNNCSASYFDTLIVFKAANAEIISNPDSVICFGGTYHLSAIDSFNQHLWKVRNGIKDSIVGTLRSISISKNTLVKYIATTANGCQDSLSQSIGFYNLPKKLKIQVTKSAIYPGDTIEVRVYPNAQWPKGNQAVWTKPFVSNDSILKFRVSDTGMLNFEVKNRSEYGCESDTTSFSQYFGPSGIKSTSIQTISVYPNPNRGFFTLQTNQIVRHVEIHDAAGRIVKFTQHQNKNTQSIQIQLTEPMSGIYLLMGTYENGLKFASKCVID